MFDLANALRVTEESYKSLATGESLEPYDWNDLIDEGVGFIIAGNSGAGKSSAALWLAGLLTQDEPARVLVLDPHWNDLWKEKGLPSIGAISEIEEQIQSLLSELDERCARKGRGEPIGENRIIITDEVNACLSRFSDPSLIQDALLRLGSEGRKFGLILIAINQSANVLDMGISGAMRSNYILILLGAGARARAKQAGKEFKDALKGVAYPCMVSGSIEDAIASHPTHGTYRKFKKKGNRPLGLLPIHQIKQAEGTDEGDENCEGNASPSSVKKDEAIDHLLRCLDASKLPEIPTTQEGKNKDSSDPFNAGDLLPELQAIARYAIKKEGWITASDCIRGIRACRGVSPEEIRERFLLLEGMGYGRCQGEGELMAYTAYLPPDAKPVDIG
jgi:energy-coupling factor transporter ATP-binding protein EcfA2